MTMRRTSLFRMLFKSFLAPVVIAGLAGVVIVYFLFKEEYDELQDLGLESKAHLLLTVFEASPDSLDLTRLMAFEKTEFEPEEMTVFWFVDSADNVIVASEGADPASLPEDKRTGLQTAKGFRFAVVRSTNPDHVAVIVGTSMNERNEAIMDVLAGVTTGFLLLGLLGAAAAYWAVRRATGVIAALSDNIAEKDADNLSPIERENSFVEIEPAIDTLDILMARLQAALASERAFATNAAHELRTPVAICLAHVQRLKARLSNPEIDESFEEIEQGLKRLVRLIERLLQMSRTQSGLGVTSHEVDISPVISLMLKEMWEREPLPDKLIIKEPKGNWPSRIDPDALGIILSNIFENALKYRAGNGPTIIDASQTGRLVVSNDCDPLDAADIEAIQRRFVRKASPSDGFGLGLSIAQELCTQSGCSFEIISPQPDQTRGFTAILVIPMSDVQAKSRPETPEISRFSR